MSYRRNTWTRQPPSKTPIDLGNPLTQGLVWCPDFTTAPRLVDLVTNLRGTTSAVSGIATGETSDFGVGIEMSIGHRDQVVWSAFPHGISTGPLSVVMAALWKGDTDSFQTVFGLGTALSFYYPKADGSRFIGLDMDLSGGSDAEALLFGPNELHVIGFSLSGTGGQGNFFLDGRHDPGDLNQTWTTQAGAGDINLGIAQGLEFCDADIYFAALWNVEKTLPEMTMLTLNPWQVFQKQAAWIPNIGAAAAGESPLSTQGVMVLR